MSENDSSDKAEELLQQSKAKRRYNTEPATESSGEDDVDVDGPARVSAIKEALLDVDGGEVPENINIRDSRLKALLVGLEEADDLGHVAATLANQLESGDEIDTSEASQSDVARLLLRLGLQEGLPEVLDDAVEARQRFVEEQTAGY